MNSKMMPCPSVFYPMTLYSLREAEVLWVDNSLFENSDEVSEREICKKFSKVTLSESTKRAFGNRIDIESRSFASAEMYGGLGISTHAGGARSAVVDGITLKGIGPTPLLGADSDESHANGLLNLIDAVLELIYSRVLGAILPYGAEPVFGILYTGEMTAISRHKTQTSFTDDYGAILLREIFMRPASFLPAPMYKASGVFNVPVNCQERLSIIFNYCLEMNSGIDGVIRWFVDFISDCADQFAFSYINGLMHGSLSLSNYSMSAKWADLTLTTFVDNRKNYAISSAVGLPSFYGELNFPLQIIEHFTWELSKYSGTNIAPKKIYEIYLVRANSLIKKYFLDFLGLDLLPEKAYATLLESLSIDYIKRVMSPSIELVFASPYRPSDKSIEIDLVVLTYNILFDHEYDISHFHSSSILALKEIIKCIKSECVGCQIDRKKGKLNFVKRIRDISYNNFFYRARIIEELRDRVYTNAFSIQSIKSFINNKMDLIDVAYNHKYDSDDFVCLFNAKDVNISYDGDSFFLNEKEISCACLCNFLREIDINKLSFEVVDVLQLLINSVMQLGFKNATVK